MALLVEGAAGWGKDFVLDKTIRLWQKQQGEAQKTYVHINANVNQWLTLVDSVKHAMENGYPLAISELNLVTSSDLEGVFNGVLTEQAKPGFRLFATINPGSYHGREVMTNALKSRCSQVKLQALSLNELETMVQQIEGVEAPLPEWVCSRYYQLWSTLKDQGSPLELTLDDLLTTSHRLVAEPEEAWQQIFDEQLALPLSGVIGELSSPEKHRTKIIKEQERKLKNKMNRAAAQAPLIDIKQSGTKEHTVVNQTEKLVTDARKRNISKSEPKGSKYAFGTITKANNFDITYYFPEKPYPPKYYRLRFKQIELNDAQELKERVVEGRESLQILTNNQTSEQALNSELERGELPGKIRLILDKQWQPLPSLTPNDELRKLQVMANGKIVRDIELAQSKSTGQFFIRSLQASGIPVTVDFIIAPQQSYFTQLGKNEELQLDESLCNDGLKQCLEQKIFGENSDGCESYQELQRINNINNISKRLDSLMSWLDTFTDYKDLEGENEQLLLSMLKEKQGVCRHKALIFQIFCHYWGIPARIVTNANHGFVEISPDKGKSWRQYELGGGGNSTKNFIKPDWSKYNLPDDSQFKKPVTRRSNKSQLTNKNLGNNKLFKVKLECNRENLPLIKNKMKEQLQNKNKNIFKNFSGYMDPVSLLALDHDPEIMDLLSQIIEVTEPEIWNRKLTDTFNEFLKHYSVATYFINWFCDLSEKSPKIKSWLLRAFNNHPKSRDTSIDLDRLKKMVAAVPFPKLITRTNDTTDDTTDSKLYDFGDFWTARTIPNSKYLIQKIYSDQVASNLSVVPSANSRIVPENMAVGLPAFSNQSIKRTSKPVIINCYLSPEMRKKVFSAPVYRPDGVFNAFVQWLAQHKPDDQVWTWIDFLSNEPVCWKQILSQHIQREPKSWLNESAVGPEGRWSDDEIRKQLNEPTAVVLQEKELEVLFDEFLVCYDQSGMD